MRTAILLVAAVVAAGCSFVQRIDRKCAIGAGGKEICICRDMLNGRYISCAPAQRDCEKIEAALRDPGLTVDARETIGAHLDDCRGHGEPVGSSVDADGTIYCRDARGREWLSKGECD